MHRPGRRWCRSKCRRVERINSHGIAQHIDIAVTLGQTVCQRFPFVATCPATVDPQLSIGREMLGVALDRDDVDRFRLVRMDIDRESEIGGRLPLTSCQDSPASSLRMTSQCFCMNNTPGRDGCIAMRWTQCPTSASGSGISYWRLQSPLIGCQVWPRVIGPKCAGRRDRDENPLGPAGIQNDGVQAHAARARLPEMPLALRSPGSSCQVRPPSGPEQRGVLRPGVNGVWVCRRGFEMPDALELPGMLRAVVPLVGAGHAVIVELVSDRLPGLRRRHRSAGSSGRTSRWSATHTAGSGSAGDPLRWYISQPAKCGPLIFQRSRLPSDVRMNAPFRVPTNTLILLMLLAGFQYCLNGIIFSSG